jgi:hypothetical protein
MSPQISAGGGLVAGMPPPSPPTSGVTHAKRLSPSVSTAAQRKRAGRYVEISGHQSAKMLPAIAARAIAIYSDPG